MTDWTAIIEATTPHLGEGQRGALAEQLRGPVVHDSATGRLEVTTRVTADGIDQAFAAATGRMAAALTHAKAAAEVRGVRVLTTEAFIAEVERPPGADLMGMSEIGEFLGVSRARAGQLAQERTDFPPAIARLAMGPIYTRPSIEAFAGRWERRRTGRPPKDAEAGKTAAGHAAADSSQAHTPGGGRRVSPGSLSGGRPIQP